MIKYTISGLTIELVAPEWILHDNLKAFLIDIDNTNDSNDILGTDVCCRIEFKNKRIAPTCNSKLIVETAGTSIYESDKYFQILFKYYDDIVYSMVASKDWSDYILLIEKKYHDSFNEEYVLQVKNSVFRALRKVMISSLLKKRGLLIHSSSIIWNDKGILFSAPSKTGKSTHAHLWKQIYGTTILDGDVNACRIIDDVPIIYGLPWCGTSDEYVNNSVPLRAIVFLQQDKINSIKKLDFQEALLRLYARCFLLPWNNAMTNMFIDIVQEFVTKTDCYLLNCLPDADAVGLVRNCLIEK